MRSPIYCDNRLTLSFPFIRTEIKNTLKRLILEEYLDVDTIAGVATAGIPQGALVADALNKPFVYVRSEAKKHGMKNAIEGKVTIGQKAIVVEDLVSTGKSSLKAVFDLREAGVEVLALFSVFTYGFPDTDNKFNESNCKWHSLCDFNTLIAIALDSGYVSNSEFELLKKWSSDPVAWSANFG